MTGGGRFNDVAKVLREEFRADGVILVVLGGIRGSAFEAQIPLECASKVIPILRQIADEMEEDIVRLTSGKPS